MNAVTTCQHRPGHGVGQRPIKVRGRLGRLAAGYDRVRTSRPSVNLSLRASCRTPASPAVAGRLQPASAPGQAVGALAVAARPSATSTTPKARWLQGVPAAAGQARARRSSKVAHGQAVLGQPALHLRGGAVAPASTSSASRRSGPTPNRPTGLPTDDQPRAAGTSWRYNYLTWPGRSSGSTTRASPVSSPGGRETTYVQTWHGTPLKRMGFDSPRARAGQSPAKRRQHKAMMRALETMLAGPERVLRRDVRAVLRLSTGHAGAARAARATTCLVRGGGRRLGGSAKKRELGLPTDRRLVLYCPTFRDRARRSETPHTQLPFDLEQMRRSRRATTCSCWCAPTTSTTVKLSSRGIAAFAADVSQPPRRDRADAARGRRARHGLLVGRCSTSRTPAGRWCSITYDYEDYVRDERGTYFTLADEAPGRW